MPDPTKTASAPSCITSDASAGVAIPPAEKFGTGSLPCSATYSISANGAERFEDPRLHEVADPRLRHDGNADRLHNLADLRDRRHARHASLLADVRRDALKRHHGGGSRLLRNQRLLGVGDVHDDAALQHL